jgi:DNA-binding PadR family transcriptional regulator
MSVTYALLGLLEERPRHGYELKRLYDEQFGASQPVRFGQVYTTLGRLRRDALVDIASVEAGLGPERKLYLITKDGVENFERWLAEPEPPESHGRNALFTKVVLALMSGRSPAEILDTQRAAHLERMRELTERRRHAALQERLSSDFELFHLEADLRWIELAGKRVERLRNEMEKRREE